MNTANQHPKIQMSGSNMLRVEDGIGTRVTCHAGMILITQEGDSRDITLKAGESFELDVPGMALVLAPRAASIKVGDAPLVIISTPVTAKAAAWPAPAAPAKIAPSLVTAKPRASSSFATFAAVLRNGLNLA